MIIFKLFSFHFAGSLTSGFSLGVISLHGYTVRHWAHMDVHVHTQAGMDSPLHTHTNTVRHVHLHECAWTPVDTQTVETIQSRCHTPGVFFIMSTHWLGVMSPQWGHGSHILPLSRLSKSLLMLCHWSRPHYETWSHDMTRHVRRPPQSVRHCRPPITASELQYCIHCWDEDRL